MELPIATIVGGDVTLESLKQEYSTLLENIKIQRENYGEFCEDEQELNDTLGPIEENPEPYSNGTCLLYTSPSPRDMRRTRMPSSA